MPEKLLSAIRDLVRMANENNKLSKEDWEQAERLDAEIEAECNKLEIPKPTRRELIRWKEYLPYTLLPFEIEWYYPGSDCIKAEETKPPPPGFPYRHPDPDYEWLTAMHRLEKLAETKLTPPEKEARPKGKPEKSSDTYHKKDEQPTTTPTWLSLAEAEKISGINRGTISKAVDAGEIRGNGETGKGKRKVDSADFNRWLLQRLNKPNPQESDEQVKRLVDRHVRD